MPAKLGADSSSPGCNPLLAQEFACLLVGFLAKKKPVGATTIFRVVSTDLNQSELSFIEAYCLYVGVCMCQCHPVSHRNTEIVSQAFVAGDGAGRVWALTRHQQKTAYLVGGCARPLIPFTQCVCVCAKFECLLPL